MKAKLRVVGGRANRQEIELSLPTIVGRAKESGLCVRHPTVSRKHCELREEGGLLIVEDLGSSNGIVVGDKVVPRATLKPGDRLTIGPLTFEAQYQVNGVGRASTPPVAATAGVPPLADTEVESDFDFLADDAEEVAIAQPSDEAVEIVEEEFLLEEPLTEAVAAPAEPAKIEVDALELDDAFDLQPMDDDLSAAAPPIETASSAVADEEAEEFALPDDIPLDLDDIELSDSPVAERIPEGSGLKLHETLEFDLEEDEPATISASAERAPSEGGAKAAKPSPAKAAPEKAAPKSDGDTLDGLDDWLGLSDE